MKTWQIVLLSLVVSVAVVVGWRHFSRPDADQVVQRIRANLPLPARVAADVELMEIVPSQKYILYELRMENETERASSPAMEARQAAVPVDIVCQGMQVASAMGASHIKFAAQFYNQKKQYVGGGVVRPTRCH